MTPVGFELVSCCPDAPITADGAMALAKSLRRFERYWRFDWPSTDLAGNWEIVWSDKIGDENVTGQPGLVLTRIVAQLDDPNDLAYHYVDRFGRPACDIGWAAIQAQGGTLTGPDGLYSAINHEHLECRLDPGCRTTVKSWSGKLSPAGQDESLEACDRLQGDDYEEAGSPGIWLANAAGPRFFRPGLLMYLDISSDVRVSRVPTPFFEMPGGYHQPIDPTTGADLPPVFGERVHPIKRAWIEKAGARGRKARCGP